MAASGDSMRLCQTIGHAWDEFFPIDMATPVYGWRYSLRCTRCETERHDVIDAVGRVNGRRYIYVEGYQYAKGERPTRDDLRQLMYQRIKNKLTKAHAIGSLNEREAS
jgi:hypothetical protein